VKYRTTMLILYHEALSQQRSRKQISVSMSSVVIYCRRWKLLRHGEIE
jgi:hypothetical protein